MIQETLELKARRYAIALYTINGGKIFLPAETYAIGDILITPQPELYRQLKAWQNFRRNPPDDLKKLLFEVSGSYRVQTPERTQEGKYKIRKKHILDLSPSELRFALRRKLMAEKKSYNLWDVGGDKAIRKDKDGQRPYTGTVIMTGQVKAMERGGRNNIPPYYTINITNPFGLPKAFYDSCADYRWTDAKEGDTNVDGACVHIGALQTYAYQNPNLVRNFLNVTEWNDNEIFLPFNFRASQWENLEKLKIEDFEYLSAKDLDLSHLKIDALVDHLFNKSTYFSIGKKLLLIPHIYSPEVLQSLLSGKAAYEVVIQGMVKRDVDSDKLKDTKKMLGRMLEQLKSSGYRTDEYNHVLEFRDSAWETICANYEKGDHAVRILFNSKFPPVFVYRKMRNDMSPEPFLVPRYEHPFSYLFKRVEIQDDRTKQTTDFELRIPTKIALPDSLKIDYQRAISEYFKGGLETLNSRIKERKLVGGDNLIRWLSG